MLASRNRFVHICTWMFLCLRLSGADDYVLDDNVGLGRRFDGIGGLSGGGVSVALSHSEREAFK